MNESQLDRKIIQHHDNRYDNDYDIENKSYTHTHILAFQYAIILILLLTNITIINRHIYTIIMRKIQIHIKKYINVREFGEYWLCLGRITSESHDDRSGIR